MFIKQDDQQLIHDQGVYLRSCIPLNLHLLLPLLSNKDIICEKQSEQSFKFQYPLL